MYFEQGQGNAGDLSKIGKEKGKTKLIICIISVIVISIECVYPNKCNWNSNR